MYKIIGTYRGNTEVVDEADTEEEAEYMLGEYSMAFGPDWALSISKDYHED